jgi:hypothetical protein
MPERLWSSRSGRQADMFMEVSREAQFICAILHNDWLDLLDMGQVRDRWYSQDLITLSHEGCCVILEC